MKRQYLHDPGILGQIWTEGRLVFCCCQLEINLCPGIYQCYQHQQRQNVTEGPKAKISATSGKILENIGKCRKNEKNTKIFISF
jgi:hypothetical protein